MSVITYKNNPNITVRLGKKLDGSKVQKSVLIIFNKKTKTGVVLPLNKHNKKLLDSLGVVGGGYYLVGSKKRNAKK